MASNWFLNIHNEETLYWLLHNNEKLKITLKRNIKTKDHINNFIYKKYLSSNRGYFKFRARGFNTILVDFKVDVLFVNWDNVVIAIYENFDKNKFSSFHKDAKFYYVFATSTIAKEDIKIGDKIMHQRLSKKETKKIQKIDHSIY